MTHFLLRTRQFLALTLAAGMPAGLALFRMAHTDTIYYGFMLWNLFPAWLPLLFAWGASREYAIASAPEGKSRARPLAHWLLAGGSA